MKIRYFVIWLSLQCLVEQIAKTHRAIVMAPSVAAEQVLGLSQRAPALFFLARLCAKIKTI